MERIIEKRTPVSVFVELSYTAEEVKNAFDRAARNIAKGMRLPGFRVGKIPASVIKRRFAARVAADATEILADENLMEVLKKEDVRPLTPTQYRGALAVDGQPFSFRTSFDILPEIDLPDVEQLSVTVGDPSPSDEMLNAMLIQALRREAELVDVQDRTPQDNDFLTVDVRGTIDGKVLPGMNSKDFRLQLLPVQPGGKVPEMDPLVRGLHLGETAHGTMPCPENYPDPTVRGREVKLEVTLHRIQQEILPPLTDETAKKLGFSSFDALKQEVWQQAFSARMRQLQREAKHTLMEEELEKRDFPLPEGLVSRFFREHQRESEHYLRKQGADDEAVRETLTHMRQEAMAYARKKAKGYTFLLALAEREGIRVSGKEAEDAVRAMTAGTGQKYDDIRKTVWKSGMITAMQERMIADKALEYLFAKARKVMAEPPTLRPYSEVEKA